MSIFLLPLAYSKVQEYRNVVSAVCPTVRDGTCLMFVLGGCPPHSVLR